MALNLVRNSRVFFTTNVNSTTGVVADGSHTTGTTFEIQVLDGFSFSQNTNSEAITVSEAGTNPVRGQRSFNTSLAPVDFSFSTYIRPEKVSNEILCEESVLWNAMAGTEAQNTAYSKTGTFSDASYATATNILTITGTTMAVTGLSVGDDVLIQGVNSANATTATQLAQEKVVNGPARVVSLGGSSITLKMHNPGDADITNTDLDVANLVFYKSAWGTNGGTAGQPIASVLGFHGSNKNQLQKVGLLVVIDGVSYAIDNAAMTQVTIDFGLDGIATAQWTGQATAMRQLTNNITTATAGTFGGGTISGNYTQKRTSANFITNKLSTATLKTVKALGAIVAGTPYYIAITGGSITINNNITYITPAILSVVNQPVTYYTGTRSVSGSLNAYLNTGSVSGFSGGGTGNLLKDMLAAASSVTEPMFAVELAIGGSGNAVKVELQMPSVSIGVPTLNTEQVVSTTINFTAAASDQDGSAEYDLGFTNDLTVRYYA
jgi:hypothetical protein